MAALYLISAKEMRTMNGKILMGAVILLLTGIVIFSWGDDKIEEPAKAVTAVEPNSYKELPTTGSGEALLKESLRYVSQEDGPRGTTLFLTKYNENEATIEVKCDESIDFIDTILAIMIVDTDLERKGTVPPDRYIIKYSGVYIPQSGSFTITKGDLLEMRAGASSGGILRSIATKMASGRWGAEIESHGRWLLTNGYKPSNTKDEMYLHQYYDPVWRIYIY